MEVLNTNFRSLKFAHDLSSVIRLKQIGNLNLTAIGNFPKLKTILTESQLDVKFLFSGF